MTDTDVLGHLQTSNLLVPTSNGGSITVVHAQNLALRFFNTSFAKTVVSPFGLVAAEGDSSNVSIIVDRSEFSQGTPATAEIEEGVTGLKTNLLADNGQLVVLELLKCLFLVDVADDTGGVDHTRTQEPSVEIVTTVVVITNLFLVCTIVSFNLGEYALSEKVLTLRTGVDKHLRKEASQEMLVQLPGEAEACPVMSVLKDIQSITLEVNISIKVLLEEGGHGNLALAMVFDAVMLAVEFQVVLDRTTGVFSLFILARRSSRCNGPEDHQDRDCGEDGEEDGGVEATAELASNVERDTDQQDDQEDIGEAITASRVCGKGGILDGRILVLQLESVG